MVISVYKCVKSYSENNSYLFPIIHSNKLSRNILDYHLNGTKSGINVTGNRKLSFFVVRIIEEKKRWRIVRIKKKNSQGKTKKLFLFMCVPYQIWCVHSNNGLVFGAFYTRYPFNKMAFILVRHCLEKFLSVHVCDIETTLFFWVNIRVRYTLPEHL